MASKRDAKRDAKAEIANCIYDVETELMDRIKKRNDEKLKKKLQK